jgi:hypothetical protein
MGCCQSTTNTAKDPPSTEPAPPKAVPRPLQSPDDLQLWERIVTFDLNLNKKPALTIAKRLSRENTNDLGDQLNISVGTMVLMEFKKFMFLVAKEIKQSSPQVSSSSSSMRSGPTDPTKT